MFHIDEKGPRPRGRNLIAFPSCLWYVRYSVGHEVNPRRPKIYWKKKLPWLHIFMIWRLISIIGLICYDKLWQTINVWSIEDVRPLCFSTTLVRCLLINTSKGLVCWLTHLSTAHKQCAVRLRGPPLIGTPEKVWYFASSIRTSLTRGAIPLKPDLHHVGLKMSTY